MSYESNAALAIEGERRYGRKELLNDHPEQTCKCGHKDDDHGVEGKGPCGVCLCDLMRPNHLA